MGLLDILKKPAPAAEVHDPAEDYDRPPRRISQ